MNQLVFVRKFIFLVFTMALPPKAIASVTDILPKTLAYSSGAVCHITNKKLFCHCAGHGDPAARIPGAIVGQDFEVIGTSQRGGFCGLSQGEVHCWGTDVFLNGYKHAAPAELKSLRVLDLAFAKDFICALTDRKAFRILCWGNNIWRGYGFNHSPLAKKVFDSLIELSTLDETNVNRFFHYQKNGFPLRGYFIGVDSEGELQCHPSEKLTACYNIKSEKDSRKIINIKPDIDSNVQFTFDDGGVLNKFFNSKAALKNPDRLESDFYHGYYCELMKGNQVRCFTQANGSKEFEVKITIPKSARKIRNIHLWRYSINSIDDRKTLCFETESGPYCTSGPDSIERDVTRGWYIRNNNETIVATSGNFGLTKSGALTALRFRLTDSPTNVWGAYPRAFIWDLNIDQLIQGNYILTGGDVLKIETNQALDYPREAKPIQQIWPVPIKNYYEEYVSVCAVGADQKRAFCQLKNDSDHWKMIDYNMPGPVTAIQGTRWPVQNFNYLICFSHSQATECLGIARAHLSQPEVVLTVEPGFTEIETRAEAYDWHPYLKTTVTLKNGARRVEYVFHGQTPPYDFLKRREELTGPSGNGQK